MALRYGKGIVRTLAATALSCGISAVASAALILPNQEILAPNEADPTAGATLLASSSNAVASASFTGTFNSAVYSGDTSNPFPGGLTFTYRFTNTDADATPTSINRITVSSFASFSTDVSYLGAVGQQAPTSISRAPAGDVIGFTFTGAPLGAGMIDPGETTTLLVVQTNAIAYTTSSAAIIDGTTAQVSTFVPVPEPTSAAFLALGSGILLLGRRRR